MNLFIIKVGIIIISAFLFKKILIIKSLFSIIKEPECSMNIKEDIKPISYLKSHTAEIIKNINTNHRPIIITQNGEAKGVFIDSDSYQKMKNTNNMIKLLILSENEMSKNDGIEQNEVFKQFDEKFKKLRNEL